MPRALSTLLTGAMHAPETSEVLLALITISHPQIIGGPLRFVHNMQDLTSNGNVYTGFPFKIVLPQAGEDGQPRVSLAIDNVSQEIMTTLKALPPTITPTVTVEVVLASSPNTIQATFPSLNLRNVSADLNMIEAEIMMDQEDLTVCPEGKFTPKDFPAMFA